MPRNRLGLWVSALAIWFCVQLAWWGLFIMRQSEELHAVQVRALWDRSRLAQEYWRRSGDGDAAWSALAPLARDLTYDPTHPTQPIQPSSTSLELLERELGRRRVMVFAEGALFAVLVFFGLWLVLRTVRREAYLSLQHQNFLHAVTHEFRSPLQSLRLSVETWLRRPDPARARGYGEGMLEDIHRLEGLVENVLAVGRLDAEAFQTKPRAIDLSRAVRDALRRLRVDDGHGPKWLHQEIAPDLRAEADPAALEPILRNLIDNARKYGEGKPALLRLAREQDRIVLRVRDHGRGFTPADRPHLFERFWRAGDERVRTAPGVGLGLFLVAELARAQNARVDAASAGPGQGAEFSVSWPAA